MSWNHTCANALAVVLMFGGAAQGAMLFEEDFAEFDTERVWEPFEAAAGHNAVGAPGEMVDGGDDTTFRSVLDDHQRKGFQTRRTFSTSGHARAELEFRPTDGLDGVMELMLVNPETLDFSFIQVFGGHFGADRIVRGFAGGNNGFESRINNTPAMDNSWQFGETYRFVIDAVADRTDIALETQAGDVIFEDSFDIGLNEIGDYKVVVSQAMGVPGQPEEVVASAENLTLENGGSSAVVMPEPTSLGLLSIAAGGMLLRRRRRTAS